jgi:hypothetical protein
MLLYHHSHIDLKQKWRNSDIVQKARMGRSMLREMVQIENEKARKFQVMLLCNDASKNVEVHEGGEIDYSTIQTHLQRGGSVFITSKPSQKLPIPTFQQKRARQKRRALRTVTAFYFNHV